MAEIDVGDGATCQADTVNMLPHRAAITADHVAIIMLQSTDTVGNTVVSRLPILDGRFSRLEEGLGERPLLFRRLSFVGTVCTAVTADRHDARVFRTGQREWRTGSMTLPPGGTSDNHRRLADTSLTAHRLTSGCHQMNGTHCCRHGLQRGRQTSRRDNGRNVVLRQSEVSFGHVYS